MAIVSPLSRLSRVVGPLPNGLYKWLINGVDPTYLRSGMILQVDNQGRRVAGCDGLFLFQWEESLAMPHKKHSEIRHLLSEFHHHFQ